MGKLTPPVFAIAVIVMLLISACGNSTVTGSVSQTATRGAGQPQSAAVAAFDATSEVFPCALEATTDATSVACAYFFGNVFAESSVQLQGDVAIAAQFALVLQVPEDVADVSGEYTWNGQPGVMGLTRTDSFPTQVGTTMTAEDGHTFLILELDEDTNQAIDAATDDGVDLIRSLRFNVPELAAVTLKPMYVLRVDLGGRAYYPPMLPCVDDFADAPSFEIPVASTPQDLIPAVAAAINAAEPCESRTFDLDVQDRFDRIAGDDRVGTAIEVSMATYPESGQAQTVLIARADQFPDALAGTPLASQLRGPILLNRRSTLDDRVAEEVQRLLAPGGTVKVLGGDAAIADQVITDLEAMGFEVIRLSGANRFATATAIADDTPFDGPVYLADGGTFPAALLAGTAASAGPGRVLLTDGSRMPDETRTWLQENTDADTELIVVGDPAIEAAVDFPGATTVAGEDPYALSADVAALAFGTSPHEVFLASGTVFADGLTGGPLAGTASPDGIWTAGGPLLLTAPDALPDPVRAYLMAAGPTVVRAGAFGGPGAIEDDVLIDASAALGG